MAKYTRVLSIDGGGIRGIIPGQVVVAIEEKLKKKTKKPDVRIADYFDLIAGTSTGGILTCIYLCPDLKNDPKRPKFSAEQAVDLYLSRGEKIFDVSLWQKISSGLALMDEKYEAKELEKALKEYFGDLKLSQLLKPCLITSYDIKRRQTKFFTQHDAKKKKMHDYKVWQVTRATSAAPTYFETAMVKSMTEVPYPLIDGGIFANNPALCAYAEVRTRFSKKDTGKRSNKDRRIKIKKRPTAKDMLILSLGTGYSKKQYSYRKARNWGAIHWIAPLIDIIMSGVSETVDYQLMQIYDAVDKKQQYLRINDELLFAKPDMDNATKKNLIALKQDGTRIAEKYDKKLDAFIKLLLE